MVKNRVRRFLLCSKKFREKKLSKPTLEKPKSTLFFFHLLLFGSTFWLLFSQFAAKLKFVPEKRRKKDPIFFLQFQSTFVWSQRKHLLLRIQSHFSWSQRMHLLLLQFNHFLGEGPKGRCILFSNSNHFFGSQRMMIMHVVLQFNYFCVCSLSLSLSLFSLMLMFLLNSNCKRDSNKRTCRESINLMCC